MTPCPSCASRRTYAVHITTTDTGDRLRRRHCRECDHRWWTLQTPEQVIESWQIIGRTRNPPRSIPTEEEFNATA